jgi:hypothetical protein
VIWEINGTNVIAAAPSSTPASLGISDRDRRYHEIPVSTKLAEAIASGFQDAARML